MKKTISITKNILFIVFLVFPLAKLLFFCFGYVFELVNTNILGIFMTLLPICLLLLSIMEKKSSRSILFNFLTPLSIINGIYYIIENNKIWMVVTVFICIVCCFFLTIKYGKPLALKITVLAVSVLMLFVSAFFGSMALIFGNISENTVVQTVDSPNGKYYVQVIDSDQGALGGDTLVDVYERKEINTGIFKIFKKPQRIYRGEWDEFETVELYWKNDNCLVINYVEYKITAQ